MKSCKCGSMAINPGMNGRKDDRTDLCDVCYWKEKYEKAINDQLFLLWDGRDGYEVGDVVEIIFAPAITVDGKLLIGSEEIFDACRCGGDGCCCEIGCLLDQAEIKMVVKLK